MKLFVAILALISINAQAKIPDGASIYKCHLSHKGGGETGAPIYGVSEKDATVRVALTLLSLNDQGEFVKTSSGEVITDIQCDLAIAK